MQFIQAANYTPCAPGARDINIITIHTMEAPEKGTTAESCGAFFHNEPQSSATGSSAHYGVDPDSIVQYVHDHDIAWAAPGANTDGLHIEHAGYAAQTKHDWADKASTSMLKLSAHLVARKCKRYHVPIKFLTPAMVKAGHSGITGHLQITESGIGGAAGTHTDPGPNFPWGRYLRYVKAYAEGHDPVDFLPHETH